MRWEPGVVLDPSGQIPYLATNASGNAVAVWESNDTATVNAALWPAALGAWTSTKRLGDVGLGGLVGGWILRVARSLRGPRDLHRGSSSSLETADLIPNGPLLAKLHLPKKGTRGVPVTFGSLRLLGSRP